MLPQSHHLGGIRIVFAAEQLVAPFLCHEEYVALVDGSADG
jgi:hypothetical protein